MNLLYYYAVIGINGYGVLASYDKYMGNAQKYLSYPECKRFERFEDAANYAYNRFEELSRAEGKKYICVEPKDLVLNRLIFRKNLQELTRPIIKCAK